MVTFYLTKLKNRKKKRSSHTIAWRKAIIFAKKMQISWKNADISKIKELLVLKNLFHETTYVCVLTYQISKF